MLLIIILLILLFGGGGGWYYGNQNWGQGGGLGIVGLVILICVLVYLFGGTHYFR